MKQRRNRWGGTALAVLLTLALALTPLTAVSAEDIAAAPAGTTTAGTAAGTTTAAPAAAPETTASQSAAGTTTAAAPAPAPTTAPQTAAAAAAQPAADVPTEYMCTLPDGAQITAGDMATLRMIAQAAGMDIPAFPQSEVSAQGTAATQLPAPASALWGNETTGTAALPGVPFWTGVAGSEGYYDVELYRDGKLLKRWFYWVDSNMEGEATGESGTFHVDMRGYFDQSGTYTFKVRASDSAANHVSNSLWATSSAYVYTLPAAVLSAPTGLAWQGTTAAWSAVTGVGGYSIYLYLNGSTLESTGGMFTYDVSSPCETTYLFARGITAAGLWTFKVRSIPFNITVNAVSPYSSASPAYDTRTASDPVNSSLDAALQQVSSDPAGAVNTLVNGADRSKMALAMQTTPSVLDKLSQLEQAYETAQNVSVGVNADSYVSGHLDQAKVSIVGAALNAGAAGTQMQLSLSTPEAAADLSGYQLKNTMQFSMTLAGASNQEDLKVPVRITMPVPDNVDQTHFRLLHKHTDGTMEEIIPQCNADGTVSFTITSFSVFVFGENSVPITAIALNKTHLALQQAGDTAQLTAVLTPANANSGILWSSDSPAIAAVDENGVITAKAKGVTTIRAVSKDADTVAAACEVAVAADGTGEMTYLADLGLWMKDIPDQTYTGRAITPPVELYDNGARLVQGTDYTVSFRSNIKPGTAGILVTAKGNYAGAGGAGGKKAEAVPFTIVPCSLGASGVTVSADAYFAQGTASPLPQVRYNGRTLARNADYTVSYMDTNSNPLPKNVLPRTALGTYSMVLTGKGCFTGSVTRTFTVVAPARMLAKAVVTIAPAARRQQYTGAAVTLPAGSLKVTSGRTTLTEGTDYTVTYSGNTAVGTASVTVAAAPGSTYCGEKTVSFAITGLPIAAAKVSGITAKMAYTGQQITQTPVLTCTTKAGTVTLTEDVDYTVTAQNNLNHGTATVLITGKGLYTGTLKRTFTITPVSLASQPFADCIHSANGTIGEVPNPVQNGAPLHVLNGSVPYAKGGARASVTVTYPLAGGAQILTEGADYTLTYRNNQRPGSGSSKNPAGTMPAAVITGKGNYSGTCTLLFPVQQASFSTQAALDDITGVTFSARPGAWRAVPAVSDLTTGKRLAAGVDYARACVYTFADGEHAGEVIPASAVLDAGTRVNVTVTGCGAYDATTAFTSYMIVPSSLKNARVVIKPAMYTGAQIIPDASMVTVTLNGQTLVYGQDYDVQCVSDCTRAGAQKVLIVGTGDAGASNYGGSKAAVFQITRKPFAWWFFTYVMPSIG